MELNKNNSLLHTGAFGLLASTLQLAPSDTISFNYQNTILVEKAKTVPPDENGVNRRFGISISVSKNSNRMIIGTFISGGDIGVAYIFKCSGTSWEFEQLVTDSGASGGFGISVSMNADGSRVIVGDFSGAGYIFKRTGTGTTWTLEQKITPSDGGAAFGFAVSKF